MQNYELVVALRSPDGSINPDYIQPYKGFLYEQPSTDIIRLARGSELLNLLKNYLVVVRSEDENLRRYLRKLQQKHCLERVLNNQSRRGKNKIDRYANGSPTPTVMSLLGHLAEALLVSRCNQYQDKNRLWGRYARQTKHSTGASVEILDQYVAIGTGLYFTQVHYRTKYNPHHTQRDIIWVSKDDPNIELAKTGSNRSGHRPAGLQLKVSLAGDNVLAQLKSKKEYEVPVVYFDLNRDFEWVAEKLRRETEAFDATRWKIGVNLICGRSVDQELHDTLLHFLPLIEQLLDGRLKLSDLSKTPEVSTAITRQFVENKIKQIKPQFYLNTVRELRYLEHCKNIEQVTSKNAEQLSLFDIQQYTQETASIDIRQYTQKTSSRFIPKPVQILTLP